MPNVREYQHPSLKKAHLTIIKTDSVLTPAPMRRVAVGHRIIHEDTAWFYLSGQLVPAFDVHARAEKNVDGGVNQSEYVLRQSDEEIGRSLGTSCLRGALRALSSHQSRTAHGLLAGYDPL